MHGAIEGGREGYRERDGEWEKEKYTQFGREASGRVGLTLKFDLQWPLRSYFFNEIFAYSFKFLSKSIHKWNR